MGCNNQIVNTVFNRWLNSADSRDANFPDAEIVRSEERGSHGPRAGPGGVQEQRHFGGPGEMSLYI